MAPAAKPPFQSLVVDPIVPASVRPRAFVATESSRTGLLTAAGWALMGSGAQGGRSGAIARAVGLAR